MSSETFAHGFTLQHRIRTRVLLVESPKLYPRATALYSEYEIIVTCRMFTVTDVCDE